MKKFIALILLTVFLAFSTPSFAEMVVVWYSEGGAAKTGLSVTVDIRDVADGSLDVNDGAMTEVCSGWYRYDFAAADSTKQYVCLCDGGSGLCDPERYREGSLIDALTLSNIEGKLPTNYIMGSSVQTDKDDEIDIIETRIKRMRP